MVLQTKVGRMKMLRMKMLWMKMLRMIVSPRDDVRHSVSESRMEVLQTAAPWQLAALAV